MIRMNSYVSNPTLICYPFCIHQPKYMTLSTTSLPSTVVPPPPPPSINLLTTCQCLHSHNVLITFSHCLLYAHTHSQYTAYPFLSTSYEAIHIFTLQTRWHETALYCIPGPHQNGIEVEHCMTVYNSYRYIHVHVYSVHYSLVRYKAMWISANYNILLTVVSTTSCVYSMGMTDFSQDSGICWRLNEAH